MVITKELVQRMLAGLPAERVEEDLPMRIAAVSEIRTRLDSIAQQQQELQKAYQEKSYRLTKDVEAIRSRCPHYVYIDKDNDGYPYRECSVCGQIVNSQSG